MLRSSRKRASSSSASTGPPSASASLAATKAFIRDRESNGALSSAAAAAALRTHATTPTPVGETVTKRMVRKASVSSQGSGSQQHLGVGLRRHSSSGSMTERTFRAPSPSRSSPIDHDAPPVPAVPKNVPAASVVHRRNSSLEPPVRGGSPAGRGGGRGLSLDRGTINPAYPGRGQPRAPNLSRVLEDEQDAGLRSSVNFSRPISPLQTSPQQGPSGWFGGPVVNKEQTFRGGNSRPKTSDGVSAYAMHSAQQNIQNAADRPVSTRTAHMSTGVEGARLAAGSMRARPTGTATRGQPTNTASRGQPRIVDPKSPYAVYDPSSRKFIHKQDAMDLHRAMSDAEEPAPQYEVEQAMPQTQEAPRYSQPVRQPSQTRHVQQSPPRETYQPVPFTRRNEAETASTTVNDRQGGQSYYPQGRTPAAWTAQDFADAEDRLPADANTSRKLESSAPQAVPEQSLSPKFAPNQDSAYPHLAPPATNGPASAHGQGSTRSERTNSLSPPRNAHFAPVAVDFSNSLKHQPPLRSVSPAKSALKASPSLSRRSHSPLANDGRTVNRGATSETSDVVSEDGSKKKKTVRISFEDEPTVLGTAAYDDTSVLNPAAGSSTCRWDMDDEEEEDEFMKPRPVLPSFGSIRDKNRRPRDEDTPEKVTETVSSSLSNSTTFPAESAEVSSDHKIGDLLAQELAARKTNQVSTNDPLPPEVTSVEGSGYFSDSDQSEGSNNKPPTSSSQDVTKDTGATGSTMEPEPKTLTNPAEIRSTSSEVPKIAVQPASPFLPEEPVKTVKASPSTSEKIADVSPPKIPRPFVPGGWDDEDISEPEPEVKQPTAPASTPAQPSITIQIPVRPVEDNSSSDDNSSIYSDAYEDIEEGEGFASIDAIMESPVLSSRFSTSTSKEADIRPQPSMMDSSRWAPANAQSTKIEAQSGRENEVKDQRSGQSNADWNAAQQHWSELNNSRQQQPQSGLLLDKLAAREEPKRSLAPASVAQTKREPVRRVQAEPTPKATRQVQERRVQAELAVNATKQAPSPQPAKSPQPRKSAMKKPASSSSQVAAAAEYPLRKSMRNHAPAVDPTPEPQMRKSMRGVDSADAYRGPTGMAASRYSTPPMDTKPPRGALQKRNLPAAAAAASATKPRPQSSSGVPIRTKPMAPVPTYDSDSDASVSSFQRERQRSRAARNTGGAYTMRSSMRSGPTPTMRAAPPVRSISPPAAASPPSSTLRKSLRPSSPTPESPNAPKSSRFSIRSLSPAGRFRRRSAVDTVPPMPAPAQLTPPKAAPNKKLTFGKSSKPKSAVAKPSAPRFKSRITDSSDDEDDQPRRFQSRFADSDSDDEVFALPRDLAPVRGIPRRAGEEDGDSTDLEDETSDFESPAPVPNGNGKGKLTMNGSANSQGASLAAGSLRQSTNPTELPTFEGGKKSKSKRGFFGLGRKKNARDAETDAQNEATFEIPMPPEQRNRDTNRPLTPIGEDMDIDVGETTRRPPTSRVAPPLERSTSDSWPLPEATSSGEDQRPQSADGIMNRRLSTRPTLVKRNSSHVSQARTEIDPKTGKAMSFGHTGKKKKFQGLRRVFGLNN